MIELRGAACSALRMAAALHDASARKWPHPAAMRIQAPASSDGSDTSQQCARLQVAGRVFASGAGLALSACGVCVKNTIRIRAPRARDRKNPPLRSKKTTRIYLGRYLFFRLFVVPRRDAAALKAI